ncbi:MAG: hemerythrin domain-containing protein [Myxococcota bacterium]|nr:hemerythrin domain-containing protein [Myxococcota bacterium]
MKHRITREHSHLEDLLDALIRTFSKSGATVRGLWEPFEQFALDLESHIEQEDRLYFPAIGALSPDLKASLEALSVDHSAFTDQLRQVADHLAHEDIEGATRSLRNLDASLRAHEQVEEEILARLDSKLET